MPKKLQPPPLRSALTTREKVILLNGAKLNGCKFWPWEQDPASSEFVGAEFVDPTNYHFSTEQLELLDGWKQICETPNDSEVDFDAGPVDLVQDVATDCSVVASLCALTARTEVFGKEESIISTIKYPTHGYPLNRKFIFKLNFNGCSRKVEVDDRLPVSKTDRALHVVDRGKRDCLWPALLEKAYLKVHGGYDFPGSNSGTDLWVLTGWIPEQIFLQSETLMRCALWKRIFNAFNYGDVLVTIGTGKLSYREEQDLGLASEHAYAIIGMKEEGSRNLLLIKNPWSLGGVWKGDSQPAVEQGDHGEQQADEAGKAGSFWMDLNSVLQNFMTIYLNWNPGLFGYRYDVHFTWDLAVRSPAESFTKNPQYHLRSKKGGSIWLLLTRHFQDRARDKTDSSSSDIESRSRAGFLSLYVFEQQHRISLTGGALLRGSYVDAPNVLLRFEMPADTSYIIVPAEQDMPSTKCAYTICAFTTNALAHFKIAEHRYPHCVSQTGTWGIASSGGNVSHPTFSRNPQFQLHVPRTTDLSLLLETADPELAIQLKLVWAAGKRIAHTLTTRDVYGDSGEYRRGSTIAEISQVLEGTYTIVCSTFEPNQLGNFTLKAHSSQACMLSPIPDTEPGRFTIAAPSAVFPFRVDRILAPLTVQRLTRCHAVAQSLPTRGLAQPSPLKLSLEFGQGANKFVLASTDQFVDRVARLPDRDLKPDMCRPGSPGLWLVVERLGGGAEVEEPVNVEVYASELGVALGAWGMASQEPIEAFKQRLRIQ